MIRPLRSPMLVIVFALATIHALIGRAALASGSLEPVDLRCEYRVNPLGIDVVKPRLSWILTSESRARKQTHYQLLVAGSAEALEKNQADVWDSGKVESDQSIQVEYRGRPLTSEMACYWKVRVWDNEGAASPWSKPAHWSMGLLDAADWTASWIGIDGAPPTTSRTRLPARMLRREFDVDKPIQRATAYVCGLGLFELYVNSQKVGDHLRDPALTSYEKRCLYVTFDLTDQLQQGKNAVGVILGNGRFFAPRGAHHRTYGFPRLRFQLHIEHEDGSTVQLVSDERWKVTEDGSIRANNEFDGEHYDARMELPGWDRSGFDDSSWQPAQRMKTPGVGMDHGTEIQAFKEAHPENSTGPEPAWKHTERYVPSGKMVAQMMPPIRVTERIRPVGISNPNPGVYIVDMGQSFYGVLQLRNVSGPAGTRVSMVSAYSLRPDGTLKTDDNRSALCTDVYTLKGQGKETWSPRFKGQGFRHVEITGFPGVPTVDNFEGLFVHTDFEHVGSFKCSNQLVDQIYENTRRTQRSSRRGLPQGEADRDERCGWLADISSACKNEAYNFDVAAFYTKFVEDIRLDQLPDGHLPDSVAVMWGYHFRGSLVWNRATMMIPETLYNFYGDRRILAEHYDSMKKWMLFVGQYQVRGRDRSLDPRGYFYFDTDYDVDDYTINHNNYGSFADATTMDGGNILGATSRPLISTAFHYNHCQIMARVARLLGKQEDAQYFADLAEKTARGLHNRFFDPDTNTYESQTQLSYLLPLSFGMVPQKYRKPLIANFIHDTMVTHDAHVTYGELGTQVVMETLTRIGHPEVGYALTQQTTRPSLGYMISKGATTIWERWDSDTAGGGMNSELLLSLSGGMNSWFYQTLGGINYDPEQPGFKHIILHPRPLGDLTFVEATFKSIHGRIDSHWRIEDDAFDWKVVIPANTTATVYVPARDGGSVMESGRDAQAAEGVRFLRRENDNFVFAVGSGEYRFVSK